MLRNDNDTPSTFNLYVSSSGDSVVLRIWRNLPNNQFSWDTAKYDEADLHPILKAGKDCHTCQDVLKLLKNIQANESCKKSLTILHESDLNYHKHPNQQYRLHAGAGVRFFGMDAKNPPHDDTLEELIKFVEMRIRDEDESILREETLNHGCII